VANIDIMSLKNKGESIASQLRRLGKYQVVVGLVLIPFCLLFYKNEVETAANTIAGLGLCLGVLLLISGIVNRTQGGESELRTRHIVSYICPHCQSKIALEHIPASDDILFNCPNCGRPIVSKRSRL
jgi:DNA-directed RNA polymerase subunit RPC12/RpoP